MRTNFLLINGLCFDFWYYRKWTNTRKLDVISKVMILIMFCVCLFSVIWFHPFSLISIWNSNNIDLNIDNPTLYFTITQYHLIMYLSYFIIQHFIQTISQLFGNTFIICMTAWRHFYRHHYNHLLPPYFLPSPKAFFIRHIRTHFDIVPLFREWSFNKPPGHKVVGIIKTSYSN